MDTTTLILLGLLVLVGVYLYNRNRVPPRGTYNDEKFRSSGSIGSDHGAYNDPNYRSGGNIGGHKSTYDSPEHTSSGSIGGRQTSGVSSVPHVSQGSERPRHDSERFKSGGSIGGRKQTTAHNDDDNANALPPRH